MLVFSRPLIWGKWVNKDEGPGGDSFRTLRGGGNRLVRIPRTSSWATIKSSLQDDASRLEPSAAH